MKIKLLFSLLVFALVFGIESGYSQEIIEDILEQAEEEAEYSDLLETLENLENNPLNINEASAAELQILPWISPQTAFEIVEHRQKSGLFQSIMDLKCCLDSETLTLVQPYLTAKSAKAISKDLNFEIRSRMIHKAYEPGDFYDRAQFYNRLRINYGEKFSLGGLMEKDAQEDNFADFYSWYFQANDVYFLKKAIVGNYNLNFGQGLLFGSYSGSSKNSAAISVKKKGQDLRSYTSANEVAGFRGLALQSEWKDLAITLFYSSQELDATLNEDGKSVTSIYESGYHRTENEKAKKNVLGENLYGCNFLYSPFDQLFLEFTGYSASYNLPFQPPLEKNRFYAFRGKEQQMVSLSFDYYRENINYFGEFAQDTDAGWGLLLGVIGKFKDFRWAALGRNYNKDFYSLKGYSFCEGSDQPQNEKGFYFGWTYKFNQTKLFSYVDLWRNPWRKYNENMPVQGDELFFQLERKFSNKLKVTLRGKEKDREKYRTIIEKEEELKNVFDEKTRTYRIQLDYEASKTLSFRLRMEQIEQEFNEFSISQSNELVYVGVKYRIFPQTELYSQIVTYGDVPSQSIPTQLPVYVYERDLPGVMRNVSLYEEGQKWFFLIKQGVTKNMKITAKFESAIKEERTQNQIRLQFDGEF